jgi:L-threonine kinase
MEQAVTITVPGTCGELIQGWHAEWAEPVLVSCPITLYSRVTVELQAEPKIDRRNGSGPCVKARRAARLVLDHLGQHNMGARVSLSSQLLPGRGMASSTADVVGVMVGLAHTLGRSLTGAELAQLACRIEPSDSTMFNGLALLAYRGSGQFCVLGAPPALPLLMLDPGYTVDTLAYNAQLDLVRVRSLAASTQAALDLLQQGLSQADSAAIGAAATLSALSYQDISANPLLEQAKLWAEITGALGLVRAHSGSVVGLLYPAQTDLAEPARWLASRFTGTITQTHLTGGGYQIIKEVQRSLCTQSMHENLNR